jgi:hypothetical protein
MQGGAVTVHMAEGTFNYTWEYQGNAPKLVLTPLTDKCFLTLTQAMALGYGGNPYGPAGTGKTESVKALGQAMARQVSSWSPFNQAQPRRLCHVYAGDGVGWYCTVTCHAFPDPPTAATPGTATEC